MGKEGEIEGDGEQEGNGRGMEGERRERKMWVIMGSRKGKTIGVWRKERRERERKIEETRHIEHSYFNFIGVAECLSKFNYSECKLGISIIIFCYFIFKKIALNIH